MNRSYLRLPYRLRRILRSPKSRLAHTRQASTEASSSRLSRIESRLPRFLQRYTKPLRNAPISHISAFLILHELTAVVPLFGLTAFFHYASWLPPYITEGAWVAQGVERFGKYLRKKGWLGDEEGRGATWWGKGEGGMKIVMESVYACDDNVCVKLTVLIFQTCYCLCYHEGIAAATAGV